MNLEKDDWVYVLLFSRIFVVRIIEPPRGGHITVTPTHLIARMINTTDILGFAYDDIS